MPIHDFRQPFGTPEDIGGFASKATIIVLQKDDITYAINNKTGNLVSSGSDATTVIHAAINALPTDGGEVVLLDGTYTVNLVISRDGFTLSGVGKGTILKTPDADASDVIYLDTRSDVILKDFAIDGQTDVPVGGGTGYGIKMIDCTRITVDSLWIWDTNEDAIYTNTDIIARCKYFDIRGNHITNSRRGVSVNDTYDSIVCGNVIEGCTVGGIVGSGNRNMWSNNLVEGGPIIVSGGENIISSNSVISSPANGISVSGADNVIADNTSNGNTENGIIVTSNNNIVIGNHCADNGNTDAGIRLSSAADKNVIMFNTCKRVGGFLQDYGIYVHDFSEHNVVKFNSCYDNDVANFRFGTSSTRFYNAYSEMFMDVLAVSTTHIRSNEDLSAGVTITFTIDAQPDVPRTLSGHFDAHANITAYTIEIEGINAKGYTITETKTEDDLWDWETDNAFATITSIKMTARTGTGAGDTMDIGITDVLGLANPILEVDAVYKIKKNNANATVATAQVDVDYDTYDMSVIGLGGGDDFTIWYRSNLNIIGA